MSSPRILWLVPFIFLTSPTWGGDFPADRLLIQVQIDGADDLHVSHRRTWWAHKSWTAPAEVRINEFKWNLQQSSVLALAANQLLLPRDLDLCGAVLHKLRGRGSARLGFDRDGLVVHFDDPENRADTYEVTIDFAQVLAEKPTHSSTEGLFELQLEGRIDGLEELWLRRDEARWIHNENQTPANVTINGKPWDPIKDPTWKLQTTLSPEVMDLQRATLSKRAGRGVVSLDYVPEALAVERGGGGYSVTMPISTYLDCRDWFSHPWAIAHEMLHNFGYGHTHEMNRLDRDVQERMEQFRWFVADHPEYIPEHWVNSPRQ